MTVGFVFIYFSSCKKEPVYSCNEGINNYVYQTMSGHAGISRDSLAKFGIDTQFAIFKSLPASGKLRIFTEKFALLLEDASISKTDKDHLETLINYVGEGIHDDDEDEHPDSFVVNWQMTAYNVLGWDSLKMYNFVETWLSKNEIMSFYNLEYTYVENGCVCNSRMACNLGLSSCNEGGCETTKDGCGIIGKNPCKGQCAHFGG
jgi:hypothetical protein